METSFNITLGNGRGFFSLTVICGAGIEDNVCVALCDGARRSSRSAISTGYSGVTLGTGRGFFSLTGAGFEDNGCVVLCDGVGRTNRSASSTGYVLS